MPLTWTAYSLNPSQSTEQPGPGTNLQLFQVGTSLYYVTAAQVGTPPDNTHFIWIQKSVDDGVTWTKVVIADIETDTFAVVQQGTKIFIAANDFDTGFVSVYTFDTTTDTMSAASDSGDQISAGLGGISASILSDGVMVICYRSGGGTGHSVINYDTNLNTWTIPVQIVPDLNWRTCGQAVNADIAYCFFYNSVFEIVCYPIDHLTVGTPAVAATLTISGGTNPSMAVGNPSINNGDVVLPYTDPSSSGAQYILYVARSPLPVLGFSTEIVDNTVLPPAYIWTCEAFWCASASVDVAGTLYVFYSTNINFLDGMTSQYSTVYRTSSVAGTWSGTEIAHTGPIPSSSCSIYPRLLTDGGIGIIAPYVDPVVFVSPTPGAKYDALVVLYLRPDAPLSIDCDNPPSGQVGVPYTHTFPATGGTPPYTFEISAGSFPDGLSLDTTTGVASGTPTLAGIFLFTVQVTDSDFTTASVDCSITIIPAPLSGGCGSPPAATVGEAYTHTFPAEGGVPPYTFSITAGALPDGLTLDAATGVVSGTPLMVQDSTYTITVTDSEDTSVSSICSTPSGEPPVQICLDSVTDNAQDTTTPGKCCTMRLSRATQGWWPMEWPVTPVTSVYSEVTPQTVTPRLLMTTNHSSILNTTPTNSDDTEPIVAYVRTPSIDGGDSRAQKLYVDVMNDLVNNSLVLATVGFNNYTFIYPQFNIPPNGVRTLWRLKISTLQTTLALWRNIAVEYRFSPGTRLYECQPASYLQPYVACHFISRGDHGFPDWQCLRDGLFALISTAPVTLTIDIDGIQTLSPYTLASTSGDLRKVYQLLRHASKGRMFIWQLQSTEPFALFTEETIVRIKSWTGDFIDTKPFSGALPSS